MNDIAEAVIPESEQKQIEPAYAMVEIFGHRQHWAEIRDVEIAGGKLLEVRDVDTQKVHLYGSGAIFSLTMMEAADIEAHVADLKRRKESEDRWRAERDIRRQAALAAPDADEDDSRRV